MREAHAHLPWHARALAMLNLAGCGSVGECLELLAAAARGVEQDRWVLASGARVEGWEERRWPSMAELDRACGGRACAVMSFDHHAVAVSTRAMGLSRVLDDEPTGGVICRGSDGVPTGVLLEAAAYQAWNAAPEPTQGQWRAMLPVALQDLARHGFTEAHDLFAPAWLGPMLAAMERAGELTMAVRLFAPLDSIEAEVERARAYASERVKLEGAKLFADGTLNSRTAWMLHPYADPMPEYPRGKAIADAAAVRGAVERTSRLGVGLAVHAIGDGAVRAVLDGVEAAQRGGVRGARVRAEHCELIDAADVPRFARLGVVASVQPCHLLADIEALRRHIPQCLDRVLPLRDLIDSGLRPGEGLLFGSDAPVVRPDPGDSLQAAVYRRRSGDPEGAQIAPGQAVTEAEAWACFGRASAPRVAGSGW
jgi:predicted amidohydrolase YtcJ